MADQATISELESHIDQRAISLSEAVDKYDVVSANYDPVNGSYIILADRNPGMSADLGTRELGYTSLSPWTAWTRDERVPELRDKIGLRTYYDMKRADGTVRGALRLIKTPILAARWFVEPATDSTIDKNIADFVQDNLFNKMNLPWSRVIEDALSMCEYGYFPLEKVYNPIDSDGKMRLAKLAPRHPLDIREWIYDDNGGPKTIIMEPTVSNGWQQIDIPIEKLVVFVLEQEGGDMRGISLLRSAYQHYYYKKTLYAIDAIQKERHGIGIPFVKLPLGYSPGEKKTAEDLARNLRTNERAHIVAPENWDIGFAELKGHPVDCMTSIDHHNQQIKQNILAPDDQQTTIDVFYKSTRYIASTVTDTFNHFVIPQLVDFNFSRGGYPKLCARRIGEIDDLRTLSFAFRNFVGAGAIIPDDELEKFLRSEMDLPIADKKTKRVIDSPAGSVGAQPNPTKAHYEPPGSPGTPAPPQVGLPRQAPSAPVGVGKPNTGRDKSGG